MKRNEIVTGTVTETAFPSTGKVRPDGTTSLVSVKGVLPGQRVSVRIRRSRAGSAKGDLLSVVEKAGIEGPPLCPHFCYPGEEGDRCGGCLYQTISYEDELSIKEDQLKKLFEEADRSLGGVFDGIIAGSSCDGYRNKMEFSFGNRVKDGPLELGLHRKGSFYDIVSVPECRICHPDFGLILESTREYFKDVAFYRRGDHRGYLRHLLVRRSVSTKELLIDLVTCDYLPDSWERQPGPVEASAASAAASRRFSPFTDSRGGLTQSHPPMTEEEIVSEKKLLAGYVSLLKSLPLEASIAGILHTRNNSFSDTIKDQGTTLLYGEACFHERICGLDFKITPFSFFQTNSVGAERLYGRVQDYLETALGRERPLEVFDLYCGTGTITQIASGYASHVTGVEIVSEAVDAARENAAENGISNVSFICGDVFAVLDGLEKTPDAIIVDPPREGLSPKALAKILSYGVGSIIYIACKPSSLARDIPAFQHSGYEVSALSAVDMFPRTANTECIALFTKR